MIKIISITILFLVILFGIWQNVYAGKLLLNYPEMGGIKLSEEPTLPEIIKYIYLFSLGIVGFAALISMLIGAIRYITSAGNASKAEDAKDQMTQAILGIIILLAAVLILRTINPDLVNIGFVLPTIGGGTSTTQTNQHVSCQCYLASGGRFFTGFCYQLPQDCTDPCATIGENAGRTCICIPNDTTNCP